MTTGTAAPASNRAGALQAYQELCKKHRTFRERSENVDVSVEVTLQPWHAFKPDGVVLFSDILTPLTGMNIPFDIVQGKGPIIASPVATLTDVEKISKLDAEGATPYVGEALARVREAVGDSAAVLGFAGAPFTLASYIVEGGSSKNYSVLKRMAFSEPHVLHALLEKLTQNVTDYCRYQADNGAQVRRRPLLLWCFRVVPSAQLRALNGMSQMCFAQGAMLAACCDTAQHASGRRL